MGALKKDEDQRFDDYIMAQLPLKPEKRYEIIFGQIYMMSSPSAIHQDVVLNIVFHLRLKQKERCFTRVSPFDLKLMIDGFENVVQPDAMLYCKDKELPCAVFEVLSKSTAKKDKSVKKELYEQSGITEYFIVDIDLQLIDRFILKDKKFIYDRAYTLDESLRVDCLEDTILVKDIFEIRG